MIITLSYPPNRFYAPEGQKPSPQIASFKIEDSNLVNPTPAMIAVIINRAFQDVYLRGLESQLTDIKASASAK